MASDWRSSTWGEEISLEYGKALRGYDETGGQYRVFGSNGPIGWTPKALAHGPGIILGRKGAYRGVHYSPEPFFVIDTAYYVVPKTDLSMRWLYYAIKHHRLGEIDDGSPIPSTTRAAVYIRDLDVPPPDEQRAIAHILGTLDDKIELNRRMNETLEAMARALFKSWFVDFDPIRAKAEGRDPGLPQSLSDLFPDSFDDSELGEIPKGWRLSRLGDEVATLLGGTPSRGEPSYWGGDVPWINSGKANEFRIVEPTEFITQAGLNSSATKLLPARTTVIAITGATLGQVSITEIAACANQSVVGVLGSAAIPSEYIYFWIKQNIDRLIATQTGGAQQHINKGDVNELPIVCPADLVMRAFAAAAVPAFERIKESCFESRTLIALRDTLLPKLIAGELRLGDPERSIVADA